MDGNIRKSCNNSCRCQRKVSEMRMHQESLSPEGISEFSRLSLARLAAMDCLYADLMRYSALEREFRLRLTEIDDSFVGKCARTGRNVRDDDPCDYASSCELLSSFCNCGKKSRTNTPKHQNRRKSSSPICKCCQYVMGYPRCSEVKRNCKCSECFVNSCSHVKSKISRPRTNNCSSCEERDENSTRQGVADSLRNPSDRESKERGSDQKKINSPKRARLLENVIDESSEDSPVEEDSITRSDLSEICGKKIQTDNTSVGDSRKNYEDHAPSNSSWERGTGDVKQSSIKSTSYFYEFEREE